MTIPATTPKPTTPPSRRRLGRTRALLAGGAVLGVGALVTLAAWSDDVFTAGDFATGSFDVQANVTSADGQAGGWADYDSAGSPAEFTFPATDLAPGDTVHAPIALRTVGSDYDADVTMQGTTDQGGLAGDLSYSAWTGVTFEDCASGTTGGGTQIATDEPLNGAADLDFQLLADESVETVCVAVTLDADSEAQGQSLEATWTFAAESTDPV